MPVYIFMLFFPPCVYILTAGSWVKNVDYYRFDGSTSATLRKKWADEFNNPVNVR